MANSSNFKGTPNPPVAALLLNAVRTGLSKMGVDHAYRKVFAIGFNKTATTSIDAILQQCGLVTAHTPSWRRRDRTLGLWTHQAFSDGLEWRFAELDRRFPRSRFILNTRDLGEWLDSRLEHINFNLARGIPLSNRPEWQPTEETVRRWIVERNAHHAGVLRHFASRPRDLLVVNYIRDPAAAIRIASFIGSNAKPDRRMVNPLPTGRRQGELKNQGIIYGAMAAAGADESELRNDLLCASLGQVDGLPFDTDQLGGAPPDRIGQ